MCRIIALMKYQPYTWSPEATFLYYNNKKANPNKDSKDTDNYHFSPQRWKLSTFLLVI